MLVIGDDGEIAWIIDDRDAVCFFLWERHLSWRSSVVGWILWVCTMVDKHIWLRWWQDLLVG